jgi:urea transport system permease protein
MSLVGAVYGTLLVNAGKTFFSESFPEAWLFLMAALFIGVTMAFPMGLAGLWESHIVPWWKARREALRAAAVVRPASTPLRAADFASKPIDGAAVTDGIRSQGV